MANPVPQRRRDLEQTWPQLGGLFFAARRAVEGIWSGRHASSSLGSGLDFYDYRPYTPGDPTQHVDWKLYGRTDRLYLRRYRRMTDLPVYLLVDHSGSMAYSGVDERGGPLDRVAPPGRRISKFHWACLLASSLAFLTVRQSDQVGLGLAGSRLSGLVRPAGSWAHLKRLVASLEAATFDPAPGNLPLAIESFHQVLPRRGLLVVISDLLEDPQPILEAVWRYRHSGFEVVVFQVLTRQEIDLNAMAGQGFDLSDLESPAKVRIRPDQVAESYNRIIAHHIEALHDGLVMHGVDHAVALTDQPVAGALRRYLQDRSSPGSRQVP